MVKVVDKKLHFLLYPRGSNRGCGNHFFFFSFNQLKKLLLDKNAFISYFSNLVLAELNCLKTLILVLTYIKPPK